MSFLTDLRAVSESALEQVADRFGGLPRPLLAAIGAGDMAVERLAELRESLKDKVPGLPGADLSDVRGAAADLPSRAQKAAGDVAGSLQKFAAQAPDRAREMIEELPGKVTEFGQSLSPDTLRDTVEAYTQLAGLIYGNLAERGDKAWTKARGGNVVAGSVVPPADEAVPEPAAKKTPSVPSPGAAPTSSAANAGKTATGKPVTEPRRRSTVGGAKTSPRGTTTAK